MISNWMKIIIMASKELRREIEDAQVEGWEIDQEQGDHKAVMVRRGYGTLGGHFLIAILTVWWTFGIGNALYATYKYFGDTEKKVLRTGE
jgi:hypothetical protein